MLVSACSAMRSLLLLLQQLRTRGVCNRPMRSFGIHEGEPAHEKNSNNNKAFLHSAFIVCVIPCASSTAFALGAAHGLLAQNHALALTKARGGTHSNFYTTAFDSARNEIEKKTKKEKQARETIAKSNVCNNFFDCSPPIKKKNAHKGRVRRVANVDLELSVRLDYLFL